MLHETDISDFKIDENEFDSSHKRFQQFYKRKIEELFNQTYKCYQKNLKPTFDPQSVEIFQYERKLDHGFRLLWNITKKFHISVKSYDEGIHWYSVDSFDGYSLESLEHSDIRLKTYVQITNRLFYFWNDYEIFSIPDLFMRLFQNLDDGPFYVFGNIDIPCMVIELLDLSIQSEKTELKTTILGCMSDIRGSNLLCSIIYKYLFI